MHICIHVQYFFSDKTIYQIVLNLFPEAKNLLKNSLLNSNIVCIKLYLIIVDDSLHTLTFIWCFLIAHGRWAKILLIWSSLLNLGFMVASSLLTISDFNSASWTFKSSMHECRATAWKKIKWERIISIFKVCSRWIDPRKFVLIFS